MTTWQDVGRVCLYGAVSFNQGQQGIPIGYLAEKNNQAACIIAVNATGSELIPNDPGFFVKPVRGLAAGNALYYNTITFEISYLSSSASTKNTITDLDTNTGVIDQLAPKTY